MTSSWTTKSRLNRENNMTFVEENNASLSIETSQTCVRKQKSKYIYICMYNVQSIHLIHSFLFYFDLFFLFLCSRSKFLRFFSLIFFDFLFITFCFSLFWKKGLLLITLIMRICRRLDECKQVNKIILPHFASIQWNLYRKSTSFFEKIKKIPCKIQ